MAPETSIIVAIVASVVLFGIIGYFVGEKREAGGIGALLGILLGPIGVLIAAIVADERKKCPQCLERINTGAKICASCRTQIEWVREVPYLKIHNDKLISEMSLDSDYNQFERNEQGKMQSVEDYESEEEIALRLLDLPPKSHHSSPPQPAPPPPPPQPPSPPPRYFDGKFKK